MGFKNAFEWKIWLLFVLFRPHKQAIVNTLTPIFAGAEVVVDEMFAAELPDKTNFRIYVQQMLPSGE